MLDAGKSAGHVKDLLVTLCDPPKLARFLIGRLPGSRQKLLVIGLSSTTQNQLGVVGPLEIGRTEARWTSDDNFVALHHYEKAHGFFPRATSVMPKQRMSFSKGRIARGYSSGTDEHS